MVEGFPGSSPTAYACPRCGAAADVVLGCGNCGGPPEPEGRELADLSVHIRNLTTAAEAARRHHLHLMEQVRAAQTRYHVLLGAAQTRAARTGGAHARSAQAAAGPGGPGGFAPAGAPPTGAPPTGAEPWPGRHEVGPAPEASPRAVQNLLFILGGLLLGSAPSSSPRWPGPASGSAAGRRSWRASPC